MRKCPPILVAAVTAGLVAVSAWAFTLTAGSTSTRVGTDGIVKVKSAYSMPESLARLKADIAGKGIIFFQAVDQSKLAAEAGIELGPSTLLTFGNPALGSHFITARPEAGLDWPVRLLVHQDASGQVWATHTDFAWIARRHGITNRKAEFEMASKVIASITSSIEAK
jgi:uncharacterized protein (DUF302 family)